MDNAPIQILIIDDDPLIRKILFDYLKEIGAISMVGESISDARDMTTSGNFDLVFLDVNLPDGNGLEAMGSIKSALSEPEVIIMTGEGSAEGAKMAIESGAWDYLLKPLSRHDVMLQVRRSLDFRASKRTLKVSVDHLLDRSDIIGSSPRLMSALNMVSQCAESNANVLITGQSGTGKELFAKVIHKNSKQKEKNFVVVDCAALPEQLVESVLFGHAKGAFTGADSRQEGLVKKADGGTLFLDEIGELPLSIQTKFLRVLQERKFKPVGETTEIESHFRLVSATNRNLENMVKNNQFRSDLFFRLRTIHIDLPPLKACKEDIKDLALHYIYFLCDQYGFENKGFVAEFLKTLTFYDWPGNTRELINSLEKAILADPKSPTLYPNYLPNHIRIQYIQSSIEKQQNNVVNRLEDRHRSKGAEFFSLPDYLFEPIRSLKEVKDYITAEAEKIYLDKLMHASDGDLDKAHTLSSLSKGHLYSLLKKHKISRKV